MRLIRLWRKAATTGGSHGLYFTTSRVKIRHIQRRKPPPLMLRSVAPTTETAPQVSASDPCYLDRRSCIFRCLSTPEEDTDDIAEGEGEFEASKGMWRYHCGVGLILTYTSFEKRLEGHRSWGSRYSLQRRNGGRRWVRSSQSRPGCHLRDLYQLRGSPTSTCSEFFS